MTQSTNNLAAYIWSLADLLRGDFKQSQYGRVILPFTLLRRLECVLADSKEAVLKEYEKVKKMKLPEEAQEKLLIRATKGLSFFNTSKMDLSKLGEADIKDNLESYIRDFSKDAREIFEYFKFSEFIGQLNDANLLYKIVQRVKNTDLSPKAISNYEMGLVFEELIRRFAESSNETAGEHFTPRDIVRLTTSLVFMEDDDALTKPGIIRTIYDPTAGYADKFDYMLSNPPFGVDWKKIEQDIKDEHTLKGYDGRFGPGLPRVSDGSLLFLMHLISKMRDAKDDVQGSTSVGRHK
jgi:type I restriction enzyme M protein